MKTLAVIFWLKGEKKDQIYCSGMESDKEIIEQEYSKFIKHMEKNKMYGKCYLKEITSFKKEKSNEEHEIKILKMCEINKRNIEKTIFPIDVSEVFKPIFLSELEIEFLKKAIEKGLIAKEKQQGIEIEILNEVSSAFNRKSISIDRDEIQREKLELGVDIYYDDHVVDTYLTE